MIVPLYITAKIRQPAFNIKFCRVRFCCVGYQFFVDHRIRRRWPKLSLGDLRQAEGAGTLDLVRTSVSGIGSRVARVRRRCRAADTFLAVASMGRHRIEPAKAGPCRIAPEDRRAQCGKTGNAPGPHAMVCSQPHRVGLNYFLLRPNRCQASLGGFSGLQDFGLHSVRRSPSCVFASAGLPLCCVRV